MLVAVEMSGKNVEVTIDLRESVGLCGCWG